MSREPGPSIEALLHSWPAPEPDPQAMERVVQRMVAAMAAVRSGGAEEPGESHFRLLTIAWAALALTAYLAWPTLVDFFSLHPVWTTLLAVFGCLSLLAPLLLLSILHEEPPAPASVRFKGGTPTC